jgi:two-component system phosphate regulon response regulator PhoB
MDVVSGKRILVVEDEHDIAELLRYNLTKNGYSVMLALNGEDALRLARQTPPDLVLLDLMLPGMDGLDVCRVLKSDPQTASVPIIMVTAKGEETDIVTGLELGAHDYICKPFSLRVLVARVRVCLRRTREPADADGAVVRYQNIVVDPARHQVHLGEHAVDLTATEFRLLHFLARRPGWVFTRTQIIEAVRGDNYSVTERAVDVQIVGLRRKLAQYGECIETVRGVGYRMQER